MGMNRREFVQRMFAAGLVTATPKCIFDMGANAHKYPLAGMHPKNLLIIIDESFDRPLSVNPDWVDAPYEEILIPSAAESVLEKYNYSTRVFAAGYPRMFDSDLKEVFPFKPS